MNKYWYFCFCVLTVIWVSGCAKRIENSDVDVESSFHKNYEEVYTNDFIKDEQELLEVNMFEAEYSEYFQLLDSYKQENYSSEPYEYEVSECNFIFKVSEEESYIIPYVEVNGCQDDTLEWEINKTLREAAFWVLDCAKIGDEIYYYFDEDNINGIKISEIYKYGKYLSVVYEQPEWNGEQMPKHSGAVAYAVVIDMLSGERVLLSDVIQDEEAFKQLLYSYFDEDIEGLIIDERRVTEIIFYGHLTERETVEYNSLPYWQPGTSAFDIWKSASFYMTDECFVVLPGADMMQHLAFPWDKVEGIVAK